VPDGDKTPSVGICQNSASMVTLLKKHLIHSDSSCENSAAHAIIKCTLCTRKHTSSGRCGFYLLANSVEMSAVKWSSSLLNQQWRKISNRPKPIRNASKTNPTHPLTLLPQLPLHYSSLLNFHISETLKKQGW